MKWNKRNKDKIKKQKNNITREILLKILKTGAMLTVAFIAPNALRMLKDFNREDWSDYYPSSIERLTGNLYRHGYVKIKYNNGQPVVILTDKGKVEILKYNIADLEIVPMKKWDGKWRIVIFDIPDKYKPARELIRQCLKNMGFYQFQESVFINPHRCQKEIKYLREILEVPHTIKYLRADMIENEEELKEIFHLT